MNPLYLKAASALLLGSVYLHSAEASQVTLEGAVDNPGTQRLEDHARLSDAIAAAAPLVDAYLLGTSFRRKEAEFQQQSLKAGLMYDLSVLKRNESAAVSSTASSLLTWLGTQPATGRVRQAIDMRLIQIQPKKNPELVDGDSLQFPRRPTTVHVIGAVKAPCILTHSPLKVAAQYARECKKETSADPDYIYIIQADGQVTRHGIASWNRADPQAVSPGGRIYIPIAESAARKVDVHFNDEFATFVSTLAVSP